MVKLYTGCVFSGKTKLLIDFINLLGREHALIFVPDRDVHDGIQKVVTRNSEYEPLDFDHKMYPSFDIFEYVKEKKKTKDIKAVFCDEIQFSYTNHIDQLCRIEKELNIDVFCFGIPKDDGNETWEIIAYLRKKSCDETRLFTDCIFCSKPAFNNIRCDFKISSQNALDDSLNHDGIDKHTPCCIKCYCILIQRE